MTALVVKGRYTVQIRLRDLMTTNPRSRLVPTRTRGRGTWEIYIYSPGYTNQIRP